MTGRAIAPVLGVALLVAITLLLAASVAVALGTVDLPGTTHHATIGGTIDAETNAITLEHRGGDPLDVRDIDLVITVDGVPLRNQPPVPFFAAAGFVSGPTGPFNPATDDTWSAGEAGSIALAGTNHPLPDEDATVAVTVRRGEAVVARVELVHV